MSLIGSKIQSTFLQNDDSTLYLDFEQDNMSLKRYHLPMFLLSINLLRVSGGSLAPLYNYLWLPSINKGI